MWRSQHNESLKLHFLQHLVQIWSTYSSVLCLIVHCSSTPRTDSVILTTFMLQWISMGHSYQKAFSRLDLVWPCLVWVKRSSVSSEEVQNICQAWPPPAFTISAYPFRCCVSEMSLLQLWIPVHHMRYDRLVISWISEVPLLCICFMLLRYQSFGSPPLFFFFRNFIKFLSVVYKLFSLVLVTVCQCLYIP